LKLSISSDGRREAPWAAMPVVVIVSSAILNLEQAANKQAASINFRERAKFLQSQPRLRRVQCARIPVVQQARKLLALTVTAFHGSLEQRFLNVARHVTPHVHRGLSRQIGGAFISHLDPLSIAEKEQPPAHGVPLPSLQRRGRIWESSPRT
jgi:hypothetical protein